MALESLRMRRNHATRSVRTDTGQDRHTLKGCVLSCPVIRAHRTCQTSPDIVPLVRYVRCVRLRWGIDLIIGHRVLRAETRQLSTGLQFSTCDVAGRINYQRLSALQINPMRFPAFTRRLGVGTEEQHSQCFASARSPHARCCGHIGRDLWAQRSNCKRGGCAPRHPREGPGRWRNVQAGEAHGKAPDHLSESRGVGGKSRARPILDLLTRYSAAPFQTGAAFFPKILVRRFLAAAGFQNPGSGHD
ncbi:hypothetical protein V1289_009889 [Bradyrhizobium sp. AZCC 2289]